ncbi:hypothetical protein Anapl_01759, partial [Anas platyrhynchos]
GWQIYGYLPMRGGGGKDQSL